MEVQTHYVGSTDTAKVPRSYPVRRKILSPYSNFSTSSYFAFSVMGVSEATVLSVLLDGVIIV